MGCPRPSDMLRRIAEAGYFEEMGKDLRKAGKTPEEAAEAVNEAIQAYRRKLAEIKPDVAEEMVLNGPDGQ